MKYLILTLLLSSCSATYHYKKAVKKGLSIDTVRDTVSVPYIDSVAVLEKDTIIWHKRIDFKDTVIYVKKFKLPETRQEIRQKEKTKRVEIKQDNKTERITIKNTADIKQDSIKQTAKTERVTIKSESKGLKNIWIFIIGVLVGISITTIFTIMLNKFFRIVK